MYSRSFYPTDEVSRDLPENYDGVAFPEHSQAVTKTETELFEEEKAAEEEKSASVAEVSANANGAGFNIPIFSNLFSQGGIENLFSNIGVEEILILAVAAFLLFSKEGDFECAIMLILLLFIK